MTTENVSAPVTESAPVTTSDSNQVSRPLNQAKPYDDELFDSYSAETPDAEEAPKVEAPQVEQPKVEEPAKVEGEKPAEKADETPKVEDTVLKRTIAGKEVEFKVADAIQAYEKQEEFNRNMDRRVTHISQRETKWNNSVQEFRTNVERVMDTARKGDFVSGIRALAKVAVGNSGLDPVEFEKQYFEQLSKIQEVYTKLTPQEREQYFVTRKLADVEERAKALENEKAVTTSKSQLQEHVTQTIQRHGLSTDEFWKNYGFLAEQNVGEGKKYKTPNDISTEDVVQYSMDVRHELKVIQATEKAGVTDEKVLNELSLITKADPSLTVDDILEILNTSGIAKNASRKSVENLNRKVGASRFNQASSTKKENDKTAGLDKEDLDFLYRNQPKVFQRPVR